MNKLHEIKERHSSAEYSCVTESDVDWLITQVEKLEEIRNVFYDNDTTVVDGYRKIVEVLEGREKPIRKVRI